MSDSNEEWTEVDLSECVDSDDELSEEEYDSEEEEGLSGDEGDSDGEDSGSDGEGYDGPYRDILNTILNEK